MKKIMDFDLRIIMGGIILFIVIIGCTVVANAGQCTHGGSNPDIYVDRTEFVETICVGQHSFYMLGTQHTCHLYVNKYRQYWKCALCGETVQVTYYNSSVYHEYNH